MEETIFPIKYKEHNLKISAFIRKKSDSWILCFHGLQSNKNMFNELLSKPFFENYSLLAIDFVGFGSSSKPEKFSYDIFDQAKICQEIILSLNLHKITIIGHSLGGMVGTLLLKMLPDRIVSFINMEGNLVLEDCSTSRDVEKFTFQEFHEKEFQKIQESLQKSNVKNAKYRAAWVQLIPDYAFYRSSLSIVHWSRSRKLLPLFLDAKQKRLFLYGDKNKFKIASLQNKIPLAEISNAGHFMLLDNFEGCVHKIEEFLEH